MSATRAKMIELSAKRQALLHKLVEPARAAANAMKDAGMKNSADPVSEILFELDAVTAEMTEFVRQDVSAVLNELLNPGGDR